MAKQDTSYIPNDLEHGANNAMVSHDDMEEIIRLQMPLYNGELAKTAQITNDMRKPIMVYGRVGAGKSQGVAQAAARHGAVLLKPNILAVDPMTLEGVLAVVEHADDAEAAMAQLEKVAAKAQQRAATTPADGETAAEQSARAAAIPQTIIALWEHFRMATVNWRDAVLADPTRYTAREVECATKPLFLFFDEITRANPKVLNPLLNIFADRSTGGLAIRDDVMFFGAGNTIHHDTTTNELEYALRTRMQEFFLVSTIEGYVPHLRREYSASFPAEVELIVGFLERSSDPTMLYGEGGNKNTPRGWPGILTTLRAYSGNYMAALFQKTLAGTLGNRVASEFTKHVALGAEIPSIDEILRSPTTAPTIELSRLDLIYMLRSRMIGHLQNPKHGRDVVPLMEYLARYSVTDDGQLQAEMWDFVRVIMNVDGAGRREKMFPNPDAPQAMMDAIRRLLAESQGRDTPVIRTLTRVQVQIAEAQASATKAKRAKPKAG